MIKGPAFAFQNKREQGDENCTRQTLCKSVGTSTRRFSFCLPGASFLERTANDSLRTVAGTLGYRSFMMRVNGS